MLLECLRKVLQPRHSVRNHILSRLWSNAGDSQLHDQAMPRRRRKCTLPVLLLRLPSVPTGHICRFPVSVFRPLLDSFDKSARPPARLSYPLLRVDCRLRLLLRCTPPLHPAVPLLSALSIALMYQCRSLPLLLCTPLVSFASRFAFAASRFVFPKFSSKSCSLLFQDCILCGLRFRFLDSLRASSLYCILAPVTCCALLLRLAGSAASLVSAAPLFSIVLLLDGRAKRLR